MTDGSGADKAAAGGGSAEGADGAADDPHVRTLAELFRRHPAWVAAARHLSDDAASAVYFRHRPGEAWRLVRRGGESRLLAGRAPDPDLVFRFTPGAVDRLARVRGGVGDFAVTLFRLVLEEDPEARVDLRIVASFGRLARRGYVGLLARAGPPVLAFGASQGVRTVGALRRLVARMRREPAADWERVEPPVGRNAPADGVRRGE